MPFPCNIIQLSDVIYVVRAVHKFDKTRDKRKRLTNGDQREACHAVIEIHVFDMIYVFPRRSEGMLCDSTHAMQVSCSLLSKI